MSLNVTLLQLFSARRYVMRRAVVVAGLVTIGLFGGCSDAGFAPAPDEDSILDGMVDGLTGAQMVEHSIGDEEFGRVFTPVTGLGPAFVAASCESCHAGDGKGHPSLNLTRFGRMVGGVFDHMASEGGPQLQSRAIANYLAERVPNGATGISVFTAPAVAGLGYLEAVDDTTLLALADEFDANGDGISGRVQRVDSTDVAASSIALSGLLQTRSVINSKYIGKFGKKAGAVNLLHQTVNAYVEDMGVTSELRPHELYHPDAGGIMGDGVPEPEVPQTTVRAVLFYLRTLRPPPRRGASNLDVIEGEKLFVQTNCSGCHLPALRTGHSNIAALNNVEFAPFTDLLLHDMGPELDDGYTEGHATTSEWRTAPLWGTGLAHRSQGGATFYLHDGRASTVRDAIMYHGGEGTQSRAAFNALTPTQQAQLIKYVESL